MFRPVWLSYDTCPEVFDRGYFFLTHTMRNFILLTVFTAIFGLTAFGQIQLNGCVTDFQSGKPMQGVNISANTAAIGAITDANGQFTIMLNDAVDNLTASYTGYIKQIIVLNPAQNTEPLTIRLKPDVISLPEISIVSSYSRERVSPIAVSVIDHAQITREIGNQQYPEIMKMVPGVYATGMGGGIGDARVSIRGFQQENLSVLLNGVPVSSVENGLVYWSNWAGLAEATQSIQVQRGLAASRVALNAVGGTINIITRPSEASTGGSFGISISDYGLEKTTLKLSTGKMDNNFALTFLGSHTKGQGYSDATYVDSWSYFLAVSKTFSIKHSITLTLMGSPDRHGQRNYGLSPADYRLYGGKYNPNWGMLNGKVNSLSENFYHKPQLNINHYWNISQRSLLATSVYLSTGKGGGKYAESFMSNPVFSFRKSGQIEWDQIYQLNVHNNDTVELNNGQKISGYSKVAQTNYLADHIWIGILSTFRYEAPKGLTLLSGVHARYFKSNLREEISDLLGGRYWVDTYAWTIDGAGNRNQVKFPGDIINVDNDSRVDVASYFVQAEKQNKQWLIFAAATLSNTRYQRIDRMNYINDIASKVVNKVGADAKAGINFEANKHHRVYMNAGFFSRAPYFKFVYANYGNAVVQHLTNEKISSVELGYNFANQKLTASINAYYTYWKDKSLLSKENIQLENSTDTRALIRGLDARHIGIEAEASAKIAQNLMLNGMFSAGKWVWANDVSALLYNDNQQLVDSTAVYVKDCRVGDAPQLTLGLNARCKLLKSFEMSAEWIYYGQLYANFDPALRNNTYDRGQPYRLPDYSVVNIHLSYPFLVAGLNANAGIACFNLMNKESLIRAEDGSDHSYESIQGIWSPGRTFNLSLRIVF